MKRGRLIGYHTGPVPGMKPERKSRREVPPDWADKGELLTRPFKFDGSRLFVNVDAGSGRALVEVCGPDAIPLTGFTHEDVTPIQQDASQAEVLFRGGKSIAQLRGQAIRLRIHLQKASVYGLSQGSCRG